MEKVPQRVLPKPAHSRNKPFSTKWQATATMISNFFQIKPHPKQCNNTRQGKLIKFRCYRKVIKPSNPNKQWWYFNFNNDFIQSFYKSPITALVILNLLLILMLYSAAPPKSTRIKSHVIGHNQIWTPWMPASARPVSLNNTPKISSKKKRTGFHWSAFLEHLI